MNTKFSSLDDVSLVTLIDINLNGNNWEGIRDVEYRLTGKKVKKYMQFLKLYPFTSPVFQTFINTHIPHLYIQRGGG